MPTQRPFFSNFLAAFRAHSALKSTTTTNSSSVSSSTAAAAASLSSQSTHLPSNTPQQAPSAARSISTTAATKAPTTLSSTTAAVSAAAAFSPPQHTHTHSHSHHHRHPSNIPMSRSPGSPLGSASAFGGRTRRGSDSSSEGGGFKEALGGEKWFIGGRTAGGEERFYRLGMVRRERSGDRASLDRMSL